MPSATHPLLQSPPALEVPVLRVPPDAGIPPVAAVPPEPTDPPLPPVPGFPVLLLPPVEELPPAPLIAGNTACTVVVVGKSKGTSMQVCVPPASQEPELDATVAQNRAMKWPDVTQRPCKHATFWPQVLASS